MTARTAHPEHLTNVRIEPEEWGQTDAIASLHFDAFGRGDEARLIARLGSAGAVLLSLVACLDEAVVGHILFTPVRVAGQEASAVGLGPMAVAPEWQGLGLGSRLVRVALRDFLPDLGRVVFVLGHPGYYPRFGFQKASDHGLTCEFDVPAEVFMVRELVPGALADLEGEVTYHPAFREVL